MSNKGRGRRHVGDVSIPSPWSGGVGASVPSGSIGCIRSGARPSKLHRPADELIYRSNFLRCLGDLEARPAPRRALSQASQVSLSLLRTPLSVDAC